MKIILELKCGITVVGRLLRTCLALFIPYRYCCYKACFVFIPIINVAVHNKACFVFHIVCTVCLEFGFHLTT